MSLMHVPKQDKQEKPKSTSSPDHGRERAESNQISIGNMCTNICSRIPRVKPCAKIVLVEICCSSNQIGWLLVVLGFNATLTGGAQIKLKVTK